MNYTMSKDEALSRFPVLIAASSWREVLEQALNQYGDGVAFFMQGKVLIGEVASRRKDVLDAAELMARQGAGEL